MMALPGPGAGWTAGPQHNSDRHDADRRERIRAEVGARLHRRRMLSVESERQVRREKQAPQSAAGRKEPYSRLSLVRLVAFFSAKRNDGLSYEDCFSVLSLDGPCCSRSFPSRIVTTAVGDMVYLHDSVTKASKKDRMRWYLVVAIRGSTARVAPRSASVPGPIFTPANLMSEFTRDGWFSRWTIPVAAVSIEAARNIGQLPEPERSEILALVRRPRRGRSST